MFGYGHIHGANFNEKEVDRMFESADTNNDGKLSYSEWMATAVNREKFLTIDKLEGIFSELDADGNKMISLAELNVLLMAGENTDKETATMFSEAFAELDVERCGEITFNQFKELMTRIVSE